MALRRFASREEMLAALDINPDRPLTPLQQMWEQYLKTGHFPDPESLGYRQLTCLYQIVSWLDGRDKLVPSEQVLMELLRRRSVVFSFEHLVISNFTWRVQELERLRSHIEVLPPTSTNRIENTSSRRWFRRTLGLSLVKIPLRL